MALSIRGLHAFFRKIAHGADHAALLGGSVEPSPLNQWVIIGVHARQTVELSGARLRVNGAETGARDSETLFRHLETVRKSCRPWPEQKRQAGLPMAGGLLGALGYDFYRWCDSGWTRHVDQAAHSASEWPDLLFFEFEDWLLVHLESGRLTVLTDAPEREAAYYFHWNECRDLEDSVSNDTPLIPEALKAYQETFTASFTPDTFSATVDQLRENIARGEIYQANLSMRLQKTLAVDPLALFETLCRRNPSPCSAFLKWPGGVIVSNSPERLLRVNETGKAQTRPIAGTRGRGANLTEDAEIGSKLSADPKERAEHLMLLDLARNDLGRVCDPGSVQVDELLALERYSHVTHLVSNVTGQLEPDKTGWDALKALFPGGTITGCPKIRCVEILDGVEPVPRGFYTGSLGYLDAASNALDFNILIRSVFLRETAGPLQYNASLHVGAGIVHDAVGAHEYRECLRKATAGLQALAAVESSSPGNGMYQPEECKHGHR